MICKKCQQTKTEADFYQSNKATCKLCVSASVREHRKAKLAYYREYDRLRANESKRVAARKEYQQTSAFAESHKQATKRWMENNPLQRKANVAVGNAVRDGRLIPWPVCAIPVCNDKPEAHHPDYSRPLDVVWLCDHHHKQAHSIAHSE